MKRLYATRVDTRGPFWFTQFRYEMGAILKEPIWAIADVTDDYKIIFMTFCTAQQYETFRVVRECLSEWVDWDYFNQNIRSIND